MRDMIKKKEYDVHYYKKNTKRIKDYSKQYYQKNKQKVLERTNKYRKDNIIKIREYDRKRQLVHTIRQRQSYIKLRKRVFEHYGAKCTCCGESTFEFLSIDHTNNDGAKHRKVIGNSIYRWLIKHNFPKEGFQILCFNCNMAKEFFGICPHKKEKENV